MWGWEVGLGQNVARLEVRVIVRCVGCDAVRDGAVERNYDQELGDQPAHLGVVGGLAL